MDQPLVLIHQIRSIKPQIATDWRKLQPTETTNTKQRAFVMQTGSCLITALSEIRPVLTNRPLFDHSSFSKIQSACSCAFQYSRSYKILITKKIISSPEIYGGFEEKSCTIPQKGSAVNEKFTSKLD